MLEKLWCPENNRILVCVDSYHEGVLAGRFCNFLQETEEFDSLTQLLIRIEAALDEQQAPQSYTPHRTFASVLEQLGEDRTTPPRKGDCATFELKILFRQHASWQGVVVWKEQKREQSFRSVLELIHLMDSALRAAEKEGAA